MGAGLASCSRTRRPRTSGCCARPTRRSNARGRVVDLESRAVTALQLLQYVTDAIYVVIAALVISQVIQRPSLARIHSALLFGITAALVLESVTVQFLGAEAPEWLSDLVVILLITLPYLLLRLV